MEVIFPHEVTFTTSRQVTVADVANSLLANEELLSHVGEILEYCVPGLTVERINISFRSASTNSPLLEELAAQLYFAFQSDLHRDIPDLIQSISGAQVPEQYKAVVTIIFFIVVVYGIKGAWDLFKKRRKPEQKEEPPSLQSDISGNYNNLIQVGGNLIGISPEHLRLAVEQAFPEKRRPHLARTAIAFIQPAKREHGARIEGAGQSIDAPTIEAAPSALDIALDLADQEEQTTYEQTEVVIHATDKDKGSSGWAGRIPGVSEKRLRMKLFPAISPAKLFGRERVVADVIVVSKPDQHGIMTPYMFHVVNVYD
jgi:hypothetical protein